MLAYSIIQRRALDYRASPLPPRGTDAAAAFATALVIHMNYGLHDMKTGQESLPVARDQAFHLAAPLPIYVWSDPWRRQRAVREGGRTALPPFADAWERRHWRPCCVTPPFSPSRAVL